jgi:hypothetical protein
MARETCPVTHDRLVAGTTLRDFSHQRVPVIAPPPDDVRLIAHFVHAILNVIAGRMGSFGCPGGLSVSCSSRYAPRTSVGLGSKFVYGQQAGVTCLGLRRP